MLATLSIRDIVIIDRLDVAFAAGLSALTGETGAGKSILLDAFALALGGRGDGSLVRRGAAQGQVSAVFELEPDHPAHSLLADNGLDAEDTLILRRVQSADGRARAFVNDQPASVQLMRRIGATLVEIHGQHDDRALVDPATHRTLLDAFGGLEAQAGEVALAWRRLKAAEDELAEARAAAQAAEAERAYAQHALDELDRLEPEAGEEERLAERRSLMMQAEKIAEELTDAERAIAGQTAPLAAALRRLERRADQFPDLLAPLAAALDRALVTLEEARGASETALAGAAFDPRDLDTAEERLFALRAAARKHMVGVDDLPAVRARLAGQIEDIADAGRRLERLEAAARDAAGAFAGAARALSGQRRTAATALDAAVMGELAPLKLERARFETRIDTDEAAVGPHGHDRVEFWAQTNPGSHPGPLVKVASGGELSRFMLALKVALADRGSAPTLVFDEIDTAVGGAVSDAIGQRLARLAERVQVLSITHAPQVAARAHAHLLIHKDAVDGGEDRVATQVRTLDDAEREEEIARMLAGATVTTEARAAASRLIAETR